MKLHQLSVFVENKPGHLVAPCRALAAAGINIVTLSLAETQHFGILRLIVDDWQRACKALEAAGIAVNLTEVVALEVDDRPGGLATLLEPIEREGINVEYMYAFATRRGEKAVLVFRFQDPDAAIRVLVSAGASILGDAELLALVSGRAAP
jgi:hypothetical protein